MLDVPAITKAIASGDRDAFAHLYHKKFTLVLAVLRRAARLDDSACMDIAQETFLRVIRKMKTLDNELALDAWLATVARRAAYDHLRAESRRRSREVAAARSRPEPQAAGAVIETAERLAWLRGQLSGLDRTASDAVDLRVRLGMTLADAGRLLGLKPGAVDGRVRRAVNSIRTQAQEDFDA